LLLVISLTYATSFMFIPYLDRRLSVFPVILISYGLIAYVLFPFVVRFWRVVFKPEHIPRYVLTGDGWPSEPVNIAIVARNRRHLIKTMEAAGWYTADPMTFVNGFREFLAIIFDRAYPAAPLSNLYLFGRKHDVGFEIPHDASMSPRRRHHVRFWRLTSTAPVKGDPSHFTYWLDRVRHLLKPKQTIWIGAATNESYPVDLRWHNFQVTHGNDGDPDGERDFIIDSLRDIKVVKSVTSIKDGEPFSMRGQNLGMTFYADGFIKVVALNRRKPKTT
jgi:hypothetical protein